METDFLKKTNRFAVVGVSSDTGKFGYKVFKDLINAGFEAYPLNPKLETIDDHQVFPSLDKLPIKPDVVVCVVPPKVTKMVVKQCKELSITKVWMQPGSESEDAIRYCNENGIEVIANMCIMIQRHT